MIRTSVLEGDVRDVIGMNTFAHEFAFRACVLKLLLATVQRLDALLGERAESTRERNHTDNDSNMEV